MKFQPILLLPKTLQRARVLCAAVLCSTALEAVADDGAAPPVRKAPDNVATVCARAESSCPRSDPQTVLPDPVARSHAGGPVRSHPESTLADAHVLPAFKFQDDDVLLRRLADMRTLPVMTLWQSRRAQIFFGVDRKGLPGLHIRQRREPAEQSTLWRSNSANHEAADAAPTPTAVPRSVSP